MDDSEEQITRAEMEQLKAKLDETKEILDRSRAEMNRMGNVFKAEYSELLKLSQKVDTLILNYMKMERRYKKLLRSKKDEPFT